MQIPSEKAFPAVQRAKYSQKYQTVKSIFARGAEGRSRRPAHALRWRPDLVAVERELERQNGLVKGWVRARVVGVGRPEKQPNNNKRGPTLSCISKETTENRDTFVL